MKTYIILFIVIISANYIMAQEQVKKIHQYYGKKITTDNVQSIDKFTSMMQSRDSLKIKIKAPITASCAKKGCWMDVRLSDSTLMKITFKDYAFFVPKNMTQGYTILEGIARKETISVTTLRHYAQDAGKPKEEIEKINTPKTLITFEAEGVIIEQ